MTTGYDDTWQAWFKGPAGEYIECADTRYRNVSGAALEHLERDLADYGVVPVVLRFEVTNVSGSNVTLTRVPFLLSDLGYSISSPITVEAGVLQENGYVFPGSNITISTGAQIGDIFEVGEGYSWDTTSAAWVSQRAFGILPHGEFGNIHTMKLKNISGGGIVYVAVGWSNEGTQIITARQKDVGVWKAAAESPIMLAGSEGIAGYMADDDEVEIEFRPQVPEAATTANNPLTISVIVSGEAI